MKKILLIAVCFLIAGCSVPTATTQRELYSFTRQEEKIKGVFGKKKSVSVKDFRGREMSEEDMQALKEDAEGYIAKHPDLSEEAKNNLRELKVAEGATQEEVSLLLGEPDKISGEIWIYRISKIRTFMVFIVPVFFVHEGYYLYFKDNRLSNIERHYLRQTIDQGAGPGILGKGKKGL